MPYAPVRPSRRPRRTNIWTHPWHWRWKTRRTRNIGTFPIGCSGLRRPCASISLPIINTDTICSRNLYPLLSSVFDSIMVSALETELTRHDNPCRRPTCPSCWQRVAVNHAIVYCAVAACVLIDTLLLCPPSVPSLIVCAHTNMCTLHRSAPCTLNTIGNLTHTHKDTHISGSRAGLAVLLYHIQSDTCVRSFEPM